MEKLDFAYVKFNKNISVEIAKVFMVIPTKELNPDTKMSLFTFCNEPKVEKIWQKIFYYPWLLYFILNRIDVPNNFSGYEKTTVNEREIFHRDRKGGEAFRLSIIEKFKKNLENLEIQQSSSQNENESKEKNDEKKEKAPKKISTVKGNYGEQIEKVIKEEFKKIFTFFPIMTTGYNVTNSPELIKEEKMYIKCNKMLEEDPIFENALKETKKKIDEKIKSKKTVTKVVKYNCVSHKNSSGGKVREWFSKNKTQGKLLGVHTSTRLDNLLFNKFVSFANEEVKKFYVDCAKNSKLREFLEENEFEEKLVQYKIYCGKRERDDRNNGELYPKKKHLVDGIINVFCGDEKREVPLKKLKGYSIVESVLNYLLDVFFGVNKDMIFQKFYVYIKKNGTDGKKEKTIMTNEDIHDLHLDDNLYLKDKNYIRSSQEKEKL